MNKKRFTGGFNTILGESSKKENFINRDSEEKEKSRTSIVLEKQVLDKIKAIAYWDRISIKKVISEMLIKEIKKYEKEKGELKPIPN